MMDYGFKFQIGDVVRLKHTEKSAWNSKECRAHIIAQKLVLWDNGQERMYKARWFFRDGSCSADVIDVNEMELELSEPFPVIKEEE